MSLMKERDCKSIRNNSHERPERYQMMERQGSVKRRVSVPGLRLTISEWLLLG